MEKRSRPLATLLAETRLVEKTSPTEADAQPECSKAAYPKGGRAEGADIVQNWNRHDDAAADVV
jgi:hypothetical protein